MTRIALVNHFQRRSVRQRITNVSFMTVVFILCALLAACASAPRPLSPRLCPSGEIEAATLIPLAEQPKPVELFAPPVPIPSSVFGHRASIRAVIDTGGRVMRDSVLVCGIPDERYARR